jgi:hypothetical protein
VEGEVAEWIEAHRHLHDEQGHRQVVRNGHLRRGSTEVAKRTLFS